MIVVSGPLDPWDGIDWWESPATAYWRGLVDGARLAREQIDREDEQLHRAAVRAARLVIDQADARAAADGQGPQPDDWTGVAA